MSIMPQTVEVIAKAELVEKVRQVSKSGARMVQLCATQVPGGFEVSYSFDRDGTLTTLRVIAPRTDMELPSISGVYWAAFTYENEMHDLFGLVFKDLNLDFKGRFYRTTIPTPFAKPEAEAAAPAAQP